MAHKFTKVLFAVEHDGKAYGVHLPADKLESLLAEAARLVGADGKLTHPAD